MTSPAPFSDADLREAAHRLGQGDSGALAQILDLAGPPVSARLSARFGSLLSGPDIEDILSETLSRLWGHRGGYDPNRGHFLAWVYAIARNLAVDLLRQRTRRQEAPLPRELEGKEPSDRTAPGAPAGHAERSRMLRRLHKILQDLPEEDYDILMAFARSEGRGHWAAEAAAHLGMTPNFVRVRKNRLVKRIRQRLQDTASPVTDRKGPFLMDRSLELAQRLAGRPEIRELANRLEANARSTRRGHPDPREGFARAWNAALKDGSLADPARLRILQDAWCWEEALLQFGDAYREHIAAFAKRCRESDERLAKAKLFQDPPEVQAERLQQAVVSVADAIERQMPRPVRRERRGVVQIDWEEGPQGRLDGRCFWRAAESPTPVPLLAVAQSAMRRDAEIDPPASDRFADLLLRDVRAGRLRLPDFSQPRHEGSHFLLEWQPEVVEPRPLKEAPGPDFEFRGGDAALPLPIEIDLWQNHGEVADLIDRALCAAAAADYGRGGRGDKEAAASGEGSRAPASPEVEKVMRTLQDLTGRPTGEVALLLAPLLERHLEQKEHAGPCAGYARALEFLWSQLK